MNKGNMKGSSFRANQDNGEAGFPKHLVFNFIKIRAFFPSPSFQSRAPEVTVTILVYEASVSRFLLADTDYRLSLPSLSLWIPAGALWLKT